MMEVGDENTWFTECLQNSADNLYLRFSAFCGAILSNNSLICRYIITKESKKDSII